MNATMIDMKCKPFSGQAAAQHMLAVESDGTVRVFDETADFYTACHDLTAEEQAKARKRAAIRTSPGEFRVTAEDLAAIKQMSTGELYAERDVIDSLGWPNLQDRRKAVWAEIDRRTPPHRDNV